MKAWRLLGTSLCALSLTPACNDIPKVTKIRKQFEIAADFDHPICEGTLEQIEGQISYVEEALGHSIPYEQRIRIYWITKNIEDWCGDKAVGCFFPGTRVIVTQGESIGHEIVHAVLNAESRTNIFLEEGIAQLLSGESIYHDPRNTDRPFPSELLWLTVEDYRDGDLDYRVAGHFMRFVSNYTGINRIRSIARVVAEGGQRDAVREAFVLDNGKGFEEIEQEYLLFANRYYPGIRDDVIATHNIDTTMEATLDCSNSETMGPLADGTPGMYFVRRIHLNKSGRSSWLFTAPAKTTAEIVPARSLLYPERTVNFHFPRISTNTSDHSDRLLLQAGEVRNNILLTAGDYLIIIRKADYVPTSVRLRIQDRPFDETIDPMAPG